jgi:serralysin
MANFFANRRFDYTGLDISGLRDADDSGFDNNVNARVHGITYEDVVWFEDGPQAVGFGGRGITMSGEAVTGGTVTGVLTETWTGAGWVQDWLLEGISVSAVSLYRAALTDGTSDDFTLLAQILGGADTFQLSSGGDRIRGYGGNDKLFGKGGNDTLQGDGGNDVLTGGAGKDTLTGGAGSDVFDYNLASESTVATTGRDVIKDFVRGADRIDLAGIDANTAASGNQAFSGFIAASKAFTRAGQLKFADGVLYGNTDGDATAEFAIALTGVSALSAADVIL